MKFFAIAAVFAATAVALPNANGAKDPKQVSISEATKKCGNAQASCCNKQVGSGDEYEKNGGLLGGILKDLLSASGQDSKTIGLFDQCSPLALDDSCQQNIACCDGNESVSVFPFRALAFSLTDQRRVVSSTSPFLASPSRVSSRWLLYPSDIAHSIIRIGNRLDCIISFVRSTAFISISWLSYNSTSI